MASLANKDPEESNQSRGKIPRKERKEKKKEIKEAIGRAEKGVWACPIRFLEIIPDPCTHHFEVWYGMAYVCTRVLYVLSVSPFRTIQCMPNPS